MESLKRRMYGVDFEVFRYDWLVVIQEAFTDRNFVFVNDPRALDRWAELHHDAILIGHNAKWYDKNVWHALRLGATTSDIKSLNDHIISGKNPWEHFTLEYKRRPDRDMVWVDTMDDLPTRPSLKAIEGYMGLPIVESSVPFDIDRKLKTPEVTEAVEYCRNDVRATIALFKKRKNYYKAKINLAMLYNIDPAQAMGLTNAKLAALALDAKRPKRDRDDERDYMIPPSIDQSLIPDDVLAYFSRTQKSDISDEELFSNTSEIPIGDGVKPTYGFGGIHYAKNNFFLESEESK